MRPETKQWLAIAFPTTLFAAVFVVYTVTAVIGFIWAL